MMGPHVAPAPAPRPGPSHDELESQPALLDRITKSGRRLWYQLAVIQQPQRARACGSGPKSSADRRPVDPPPVVELRIFEGNTWQEAEQNDITFLYNANFFLYTTLEHARVIAHGRVQTPAANQPPVLTGMPVSGMAYLDRPEEAGYFLFPDLSVRHEGRYRLNFNLYEETKEDKDKDPDTPDSNVNNSGLPNATGGSFDFRMEVKSNDFVVFSAKKFPGLTESTNLSRMVAEQGCRVRIRRDVRMRRRDNKSNNDYEANNNNNNADDEYARRKRTETPEVKQSYRARSMSGSVERSSFSAESQRRSSGADYPQGFPSQPGSAGGHLQFLGNAAQYPPQAKNHAQPPSMPPSPSYQTSHGAQFPPHPATHQPPLQQVQHHNVHPQAPPQHTHQAAYAPPHQQQAYDQADRSQPQQYGQVNPPPQREAPLREFRDTAPPHYREPVQRDLRDTAPPSQLYRQQSKEYILPPPMVKPIPMSYHQPPPRANTPLTLPPIHDLSKHLTPRSMPPLSSPTADRVPPLQAMPPPKSTAPLPPPPSVAGSKRSRDDSIRYEVDTPRYHNGEREDPQLLDDSGEPALIYGRADGRLIEVNHPVI